MAKPGPKPGSKRAPKPESVQDAPAQAVAPAPIPSPEPAVLTTQDRENPAKLSGQALRDLAHRRGIARSESARMTDEKLREQLKYATYRQYEADDAVV